MERRLHTFLNAREYDLLLQLVERAVKSFPDIIGVLGMGSFVQPPSTPDDFFMPRYSTARGRAYEQVRNPGRRRLSIHESSDLDIWVCTKDTLASQAAQEHVELSAIALLSELVSGTLEWGSLHWHNKKVALLGQYYKNSAFYSQDFIAANGDSEPWMAQAFKALLERYIVEYMPDFVRAINQRFKSKIPGDFLEVRAFPESLFHLRPDDTVMSSLQEDRMAFPRVANDQWIGPEYSSLVLYASEDVTIYPFREDGPILGSRIAKYLAEEDAGSGKSYGSLVIKPDAIKKGQLDIIMAKIHKSIASFNGCIAARKVLDPVTEDDVETIYPLLKGRDLKEAKDYLVGGQMIILIIESTLPSPELFKHISRIKGPRLIDRSYERLMEGRILDGTLRDLLPVPGDEDLYKEVLPTILAKKANPSIRFSDEQYKYYAQNLVHSPDNEVELHGLFQLSGFFPM